MRLTVDFINTAPGAPLPNFRTLVFNPGQGQELQKITFISTAKGPLRAAFDVPTGTPGMAHTTQRGLFDVPGQGNGVDDNFPAEHIEGEGYRAVAPVTVPGRAAICSLPLRPAP
jgi:hypothetical protein